MRLTDSPIGLVIFAGLVAGSLAQVSLMMAPPARLTLKVFPWVCNRPCTVRVMVQVDPNVENRHLVVTANGDNYYSSSTIDLDGENAPYTQPFFWFNELPSGVYRVDAVLQSQSRDVDHKVSNLQVN